MLRQFGNTDLQLSPIGLGAWQFSRKVGMAGKYWPNLTDESINELVALALAHNINWFDTAEVYGKGASEKALAAALDKLQVPEKDARIATKWWPLMRPASNIRRNINNRIAALNNRSIDLFQIHNTASLSSIEKQMAQMANLVQNKKIRYIGVSNFSAQQMEQAHLSLVKKGLFLASNQVKYSLLDRRIEQNGILETARKYNIAIIAYSPLEQGVLTGRFHRNPESINQVGFMRRSMIKRQIRKADSLIPVMQHLSDKYDKSLAQISLNWLIHAHEGLVFAIPGATKPTQVMSNADTMNFQLSISELQMLSEASKPVPLK